MYPSLIKRPIRKPPPFHITRLSRASVHGKTETAVKNDGDFFATTTFPHDLEAPGYPQDQSRAIESKASAGHEDEGITEQHSADIYESILPKEQREGVKREKRQKESKDPNEIDQGPNMDEL